MIERKAFSRILCVCLLLLLSSQARAQFLGFRMSTGAKVIEFPFERYNNLIIIPVTINGRITVKFILDSGVQNCILTEPLVASLLNLTYDRTITFTAPGQADSILAHVAKNVQLKLPGIEGQGISMLVLDQDYLNLSNQLGTEVFGIIGYELFSRFIIEVNYDKKVVKFYEPNFFNPKKYYEKVPLIVRGTKPYMAAEITQKNGTKMNVALMVDSGASHAILLDQSTSSLIHLPEKNLEASLGKGLGGDIEGVVARVDKVKIGKYSFDQVIASYPNEGSYGLVPEEAERRNGTVGGEILSRFNHIYDYFSQTLYLSKSVEYQKKFEYDMSGLEVVAHGTELNRIRVVNVRENSPAKRAGVMEGDIIKTVNGLTITNTSLNFLTTLMRLKKGKKVTLRLLRNAEEVKVTFRLERMI
ncbi:MAG: aspartyl protease family protein [Imperialibacter sp.]|uniref:aspartyl protease family protein n=1 Tax=Imperialibacter sp. TaxID=2038411 RepID=UPI0032EE3078